MRKGFYLFNQIKILMRYIFALLLKELRKKLLNIQSLYY